VDNGDVLYLADGAVRLRVGSVDGGDVVTMVEVGGSVASRQGPDPTERHGLAPGRERG
jgi:pyruvate kinase